MRWSDFSEQGSNLTVSHDSFLVEAEQVSKVQERSRIGN